MKKLLVSVWFIVCTVGGLRAQSVIPNHSFEEGNGSMAKGWVNVLGQTDRIASENFTVNGNIQTQKAFDGEYFFKLVTIADKSPGIVLQKFAYHEKPRYIDFRAMYSPKSQEDRFVIQIQFFKYDNLKGKSSMITYYNLNSKAGEVLYPWTKVDLEMNYDGIADFDTMAIAIYSTSVNQIIQGVGTALYIDNLRFTDDPLTVKPVMALPLSKLSVYPNPTAGQAIMTYTLPQESDAVIQIYDAHGKVILHYPQGNIGAGEHHFTVNLSNCQPGIYFFSVVTAYGAKTEKLLISR